MNSKGLFLTNNTILLFFVHLFTFKHIKFSKSQLYLLFPKFPFEVTALP